MDMYEKTEKDRIRKQQEEKFRQDIANQKFTDNQTKEFTRMLRLSFGFRDEVNS